MDYYNFNPDIADSLGFLSPYIQRKTCENYQRFLYNYSIENERFRRDTFINQQYYRTSSTSLVLKKKTDREIIEDYCYDNIRYRAYPKQTKQTQIPKHRPLIRVTIIPNNQTSKQTKLRKRRALPKKIQSSVSNHEGFFTAKNVYLVVAGNKREKVYEVKTTGSEHSNVARFAKDDRIPVEHNFQKLLTSLNMDKKKKKDKGKGKKEKDKKKEVDLRIEEKTSGLSLMNMMAGSDSPKTSMLRECICSPPMESVSPRKSRVRITGKIGLTEDDRYVLKCAATVDGKPVDTSFFEEQNRGPSMEQEAVDMRAVPKICVTCPGERVVYCQREPNVTQRDEIIQTNLEFEDRFRQTYPCPAFMTTCPAFRSVETQCPPQNVNTVCFANVEKLKIFSNRDEVVQCECPQEVIVNSKQVGAEVDYDNTVNNARSCNSPLVIISVYPKKDSEEKSNDETSSIENHNREAVKEKSKGKKGGKRDNNEGKKESRAASPTRAKSPTKGKAETKADKKGEKAKDKGEKGKEKGNTGKGKKKGKEPKESKKGVKKEQSTQNEDLPRSRSPERRQSGTQFGISVGRCNECCMNCSGSKKSQDFRHTAQFNTKRIMNWVSAKQDVSNVAIGIDGENEFYDVLYRQYDDTTDVQIRKTIKGITPTKTGKMPTKIGVQGDDESLKNFFLVNDDVNPRKRSFSQTFIPNRPLAENTKGLDTSVPRLNVRDSIEISHRREEKDSNSVKFTSSASSSTTYTSKTKLDQVKHYQGDNCDLSNPVERDKEIRELLGIEKPKRDHPQSYEQFAAKADGKRSVHCFYRRPRKAIVNANFRNVQELQCICVEDTHTQATDDEDVEYLDEEYDAVSITENEARDGDDYFYKRQSLEECCSSKQQRDSDVEPAAFGTKESKKLPCEVKKTYSYTLKPNKKQLEGKKLNSKESPCYSKLFPLKANCSEPDKKVSGFIKLCSKYCTPNVSSISSFDLIEPTSIGNKTRDLKTMKLQKVKKNTKKDEKHNLKVCAQVTKASDQFTQHQTTNYCTKDACVPSKSAEVPPICNQLLLSRNINIFLQIDQFTKQKPIVLTRKQYNKVKKTIECATTKKNNCVCKVQSKLFSVGEMKKPNTTTTNNQCCPQLEQKVLCPDQQTIQSCTGSNHKCPCELTSIPIPRPECEKCIATTKLKHPYLEPGKPSLTHIPKFREYTKSEVTSPHKDPGKSSPTYIQTRYSNPIDTQNLNPQPRIYDGKKVNEPSKDEKVVQQSNGEEKAAQEKRKRSKYRHKPGNENFDQKENVRIRNRCKPTVMKPVDFDSPSISACWRTAARPIVSDTKSSFELGPAMVSPDISHYDTKDVFVSCKPLKIMGDSKDARRCCIRCGRLKQQVPCTNCSRQNKNCLHTCYCYGYNLEVKDDSADSSVKEYNVNDLKSKRYAASSTEIRYTNVLFANCTKHVTFSSTNVGNIADENGPVSVTNLLVKNFDSNSLRTIFKGRRKAPTPNLGTSAYSLYSEYSDNVMSDAKGAQGKPMQERKPFLRRLMSCLVMRSKTSQVKIDHLKPRRRQTSYNTSVDSYHINTSLGAVDLTSSIYDTSASFYSNHSIQPINRQNIKRGFLSSVRGFLTNRKT